MTDRPILFSAPMVRALLAGTKTMTRRIVKPQPRQNGEGINAMFFWKDGIFALNRYPANSTMLEHCPYGQPGDRLWVRETHMLESNYGLDNEANYPPPFKDGRPIKRESSPDWGEWWTQAHYAATDPKPELCKASDDDRMAGWRPSIHMPRWASRITLEITGVRVERLNDISEEDCQAEGCQHDAVVNIRDGKPTLRVKYRDLWESINGAGSWAANPWVWVVEFKRITTDAAMPANAKDQGAGNGP